MAARGEVTNTDALGRMLQQGRMVSGLTQRELADRVDTDQKYIWSLESGKNAIILERIFAIMRETGVRMYMEVDEPAVDEPAADATDGDSADASRG